MNWGVKVVIGLSFFVGLIISMVVICMRQNDLHLVASDYYEQEIVYQHTIDEMNNLKKLGVQPVITYHHQSASVEVDFSSLPAFSQINGSLRFFRPSDPSLDFTENITLNAEGKQTVAGEKLHKGKWIVKMQWSNAGIPYYLEQTLVIA